MKRIFAVGITVLLLLGIPDILQAQNLTNIPANVSNTRLGSHDVFSNNIVRPALSIRGFDSSKLPGGTGHGLGMKQILEKLLTGQEEIDDVIDNIVGQADSNLETPTGSLQDKRKILDTNSRVTQSRAFVALATYILDKNGYTSERQSIFGKTHAQALQELKNALLGPPSGNHI